MAANSRRVVSPDVEPTNKRTDRRVMSTSVLGIHNGHNASAAVIEDGILAFALQEERLSRIKNHGGLPAQALVACAGFLGSGDDGNIAAALGGHNLTRCDWRRDDILLLWAQITRRGWQSETDCTKKRLDLQFSEPDQNHGD